MGYMLGSYSTSNYALMVGLFFLNLQLRLVLVLGWLVLVLVLGWWVGWLGFLVGCFLVGGWTHPSHLKNMGVRQIGSPHSRGI